ncbi:TetR/AcrR family transcriptional regulator [Streptomyces sp. NPDC020125]|uniref:TetR/AcrR family transcriptional regulator n=1 Tax=Streptomyces sp. NPDC020125 TaxID=3154593 RepID=UPI0033D8730E
MHGAGDDVEALVVLGVAMLGRPLGVRGDADLSDSEALSGVWPAPAEALAPVADSADPVERTAFACEFLLRGVLAREGAVRAMIAATITRPATATARPGIRFGLIDHALRPLDGTLGVTDPEAFAQLKRDLAVVVSAEALFTLMDLCGLDPQAAVDSAVRTATSLTQAAVRTIE